MPTSVLLAILVAAGLLALAPALVRRHDAVERQVAERAHSPARVLSRHRRRRSVPVRRPPARSRALPAGHAGAAEPPATGAASAPAATADPGGTVTPGRSATPAAAGDRPPSPPGGRRDPAADPPPVPDQAAGTDPAPVPASGGDRPPPGRRIPEGRDRGRHQRPDPPRRTSPAIYRRRRVLAALVLLNAVELSAVAVVGPGFWVGFAVTATLLFAYLVHLRSLAVADRRRRRAEARRAALLAAQQAEVRRIQQRRALARRQAARRMAEQRESLRRAAATGSVSSTVLYRAVPPRRHRAG